MKFRLELSEECNGEDGLAVSPASGSNASPKQIVVYRPATTGFTSTIVDMQLATETDAIDEPTPSFPTAPAHTGFS
jgi:hypothetical protein